MTKTKVSQVVSKRSRRAKRVANTQLTGGNSNSSSSSSSSDGGGSSSGSSSVVVVVRAVEEVGREKMEKPSARKC